MRTTPTPPAGRLADLVGSRIAGLALAVLMVQHSAARRQRSYAD